MKRILILLAAVLAGMGFGPAAQAFESNLVTTPHAEVRLVAETETVVPGGEVRLGLHFRLTEGWHVYWVNPGAAGEPPRLDLSLPEGADAGDIVWPAPHRIVQGPTMTYGYEHEVLFPLTVTTPAAGGGLVVDASASWLICAAICVPEDGSFRLDLAAGPGRRSGAAPLFDAADARAPRPSPFEASVAPDATLAVAGAGISPAAVKAAWFLPIDWGAIEDAAQQRLAVADGRLSLALAPGPAFDPKAALRGVLVLVDPTGTEAYLSVTAVPGAPAGTYPEGAGLIPELGLPMVLAFAFLGGLILNLMPCVFPILAIKAMSVAGLAGRDRKVVRAHAASYVAGVVLGFGALGGLLLVLRGAGLAAGWGFQFQSPVFVAVLAWLLLAIGLNLSGVFEIGGRFVGAGGRLAAHGGHTGSFFTGLLAVLVATPCTAPFMSAAVAAAAVSPPAVTLLIFVVMGFGLAAPYGVLGLAPALAGLLPKPGRWMVLLKQALAFPMYGAAAWLAWVIGEQVGADGVLVVLTGAVLVGFAGWLFGIAQGATAWRGRVGHGLAAMAVIAVLALLAGLPDGARDTEDRIGGPAAVAGADAALPYSPGRLAELRADGKPVFVNMTAAWCVTCIVNEQVVLSTAMVRGAFAARGVTYLKGDWTRADPAITEYLRKRGRDGVPLYVLYPPDGRQPVVLPQILTVDVVLDELERFGS